MAGDVAESININCIGTLALLIKAKRINLMLSLKEIFLEFLIKKIL